MIRIDRAGQSSKRYAGASNSPLVESDARCPLWQLHNAFDRPGQLVRHIVELDDSGSEPGAGSSRWFTLARTVQPQPGRAGSIRAEFAVGLGIDAKLAAPLAAARGINLTTGEATPIGLGCRTCTRPDCPQRSAPPTGRVLVFNERERGLTPFIWAGE
jgi:predicted transcriptional regulator